MKHSVFLFILLMAVQSSAGMFAEFNGYYNSDKFMTATAATDSKIHYGLDIYANLESRHKYYAGFHVDQWNLENTLGTATTSLKSLNMGPMFLWIIDRRRIFNLSLGYGLTAKGTLAESGSSTELFGTSLFGSLAAMPEVAENFYFGIKLNYYSLSYTKSTVGTTSSDVSYNRVFLFPSISFAWRH